MKICLDLWCGSKSFSKGFREKGFVCLSLDNDPKFNPTFCVDIFEWQPPPGMYKSVDCICAGPVCTLVSTARKCKDDEGFALTKRFWERTFELVDLLLKPGGVAIFENPGRTEVSSNKCRGFPIGIVEQLRPSLWSTTVNYCMYSTEDRMFSNKETKIWSTHNLEQFGFQPRRCTSKTRCAVGRINPKTNCYIHNKRLTFVPEARNRGLQSSESTRHGRWSEMPHGLIVDLAQAADRVLKMK